ncbi:clathrin interactor 1 isoform X2 [Magallana gigas]|uniref:clathrin interactor 1 isoform X2 n=1 Tax=Magallana gigas TaxID=29159 RepID=UPI0005C38E64|eukprot:XP_011447954.1 PREDICTED: clathrin interactor 1 isoform X1 [Crassostrea gigas]
MWKLREITDKVTNVVMNYTEVETKVREATNDDAWGPHGQIMQEIARYTFTYEHFPEVMGMLWKRMLHDNKKNWRRTYKSLLLLAYLVRNGSEKSVTSCREHLYDLRGLESYTFTDELGKDQGLNVRTKAKELVDFIQDDERLREERKKAKKNRDKYIGMSGDSYSSSSRYSDRYDEEPASTGGGGGGGNVSSNSGRSKYRLDEIDDWETGNKSIATEAVDKVKGLWNKVQGRRGPDDIVDYSSNRAPGGRKNSLTDFRYYKPSSDEPENKCDDFDDTPSSKYSYKDDDEEFTSVERTHTTRTEKITTNRRTRSVGKKLDLGASSSLGKDKSDTTSQTSSTGVRDDFGPSLLDMGNTKSVDDGFADFKSATANGDFNPRGDMTAVSPNKEFGDFAAFDNNGSSVAKPTGSDSFADFSQFNPAAASSSSSETASNDLLDVFGNTPASVSSSGNMGIPAMGNMNMSGMNQPMMGVNMNMGMSGVPNQMGMNPQMMGMTSQPQMTGMNMAPGMSQGMMAPMGMQQPMMMQPGMPQNMGFAASFPMQTTGMVAEKTEITSITTTSTSETKQKSANTWTDTGKVNIDLDGLGSTNKFLKHSQPSMNQLQQQSSPGVPVNSWNPELYQMGYPPEYGMMLGNQPGMSGLQQGMQNMAINPGSMMGQPAPMMGHQMGMSVGMQGNMGMQAGMMGNMPVGSMGMQSKMMGQSQFQQKTDAAFSAFGNFGKK